MPLEQKNYLGPQNIDYSIKMFSGDPLLVPSESS